MKFLALVIFVYVIGMFLGSTFEYHSADASQGQAYTTGNAAFTNGSATVTGAGTTWVAAMEGGIMKNNTDDIWCKIDTVDGVAQITLAYQYTGTGGVAAPYTMAVSGGWAGAGSAGLEQSPSSTLQYLTNLNNAIQQTPLFGGAISIPFFSGDYFDAVFKTLTWQFDFLFYDTLGHMFYWIVCLPFVVASVASIGILLYGLIFGGLTWS